jgi:predicted PurR-regulated permease PerM
VSRLDQVRASMRRAYESGRDSVRAARARERATSDGNGSAGPHGNGSAGPHGNGSAGPDGNGSAGSDGAFSDQATIEPSPPEPFELHPTTASRDDADVPHALRIAAAWSWRLIVIGVVAWAVLRLVGEIKFVIIPLAIALLLSALLAPAVGWLLRARLPRSLATAVVLLLGIAAVAGTLTLVVNEFINGAPDLADNAGRGVQQIQSWLRTGPLHLSDSQVNSYVAQGQQWLNDNRERLTSTGLSTAGTVAEVLTGALLVLFSTFFFLRDGRRIWRFLVRLLPVGARWRVDDAGQASWATLGSYVRATVLVAFIDAVGIGIFLVIFRVQFAFALAALVFLGAFIPIVGATLSGAVAVLVALVDRGPVIALIILGVVIGVQQLEGHVLQPLIMGRAVAIHPLVVIVGIATGVVTAGIVGALVAVPLIAVLNTAVRRLSKRRPPEVPPEAVIVAARSPS